MMQVNVQFEYLVNVVHVLNDVPQMPDDGRVETQRNDAEEQNRQKREQR